MRFGLSLACLASVVLAQTPDHGYAMSYGNALHEMKKGQPIGPIFVSPYATSMKQGLKNRVRYPQAEVAQQQLFSNSSEDEDTLISAQPL